MPNLVKVEASVETILRAACQLQVVWVNPVVLLVSHLRRLHCCDGCELRSFFTGDLEYRESSQAAR